MTRSGSPLRLAALIALLGVGVGWGVRQDAAARERTDALGTFQGLVDHRAGDLEKEGRALGEVLYAHKGLFDASDEVTREEFATFAAEPLRRLQTVESVAWAPAVPLGARAEHEARQRTIEPGYAILEGRHPAAMRPAGRRPTHFPILYVQPRGAAELRLGFDIGSNPVLRRALDLALSTGTPVLSAALPAIDRTPDANFAVMVLPVHHRKAQPGRRPVGSLAGFVLLTFHPGRLLAAHEGGARGRGGARQPAMRLRLTGRDGDGRPAIFFYEGPWFQEGDTTRDAPVEIAGRTWNLQGVPTAAFLATHASSRPALLGALAFLVWCALGGLLLVLPWRRHRRALSRQDRQMRAVLGSVREGVVVADAERGVVYANPAAERTVGVRLDESSPDLWSSTFGGSFPPGSRAYREALLPLARAMRGEVIPEDEILLRRPGQSEAVWLEVSGAPLHDEHGDVQGGVVVFRDVSERKRQQEELRRLSRAVEQTADAVVICDEEGTILYANPACETITGRARETVVGADARHLGLGAEDPTMWERAREAMRRGVVFRGSGVNRRPDGSTYHGEHTISPVHDDGEPARHFAIVCRDISERRRVQYQQTEMQLASQVQARLYPSAAPQVDGFDIAAAVYSADATCGDYFDFIPLAGDRLAIAIGDVSGHGLGPALVMTQVRAYLRSFLLVTADPGEVMARIDRVLAPDLEAGIFVTLIVAVLDLRTRHLRYANAGHVPACVLDATGHTVAKTTRTGLPLGVRGDGGYTTGEELVVAPGQTVAFFTDGVTESQDPTGECLWEEGAASLVAAHLDEPARDIVDRLYDGVRDFARGRTLPDDVTMIILKSLPVVRAPAERAPAAAAAAAATSRARPVAGRITRRAV